MSSLRFLKLCIRACCVRRALESEPELQLVAALPPPPPSGVDQLKRRLEVMLDSVLEACEAREAGRVESEARAFNRMDGNLVRRFHDLRLDVEETTETLGDRMEALLNDVGAKIAAMSPGGLSDEQVLRKLGCDVASLRWPVPRLVCLLPKYGEILSEDDRSYSSWSARLKTWCNEGKKEGKGKLSRKLRLFFLCAHDLSLAECGHAGQGYKVKELLEWVKKARPLAKVGLVIGSIAVKTFAGLSVPIDHLEAAFGDTLGGAVSDVFYEAQSAVIEGMTSAAYENLNSGGGVEQLREFIEAPKVSPKQLRFTVFRNPVICFRDVYSQ